MPAHCTNKPAGEQSPARVVWFTACPRCGKTGEVASDKRPRVHCGDCLVERVEVVEMLCERVLR